MGTKVNAIFQLWDISKTLFTYKLKVHRAVYFSFHSTTDAMFISDLHSEEHVSCW
jgi:hypothetical protein